LRSFLLRLLAFSIVPAFVLALGETVILGSGEAWSIERVLARQQARPGSLYLRGIDQSFYAYKFRGVLERRPQVLVAGSSRTMKFRSEMFGNRASAFYNAGGMVTSLRDLRDSFERLPSARTPDVLLLGVDLWWLNDQVPPNFSFDAEIGKDAAWNFDQHIVGLRWLLKRPGTFANEASGLIRGAGDDAIGIGAREQGGGFRADGSFKSPLQVPRPGEAWLFVDREVPPIIERVRSASANFPPASQVSPERLDLLDLVLTRYEKAHVLVMGYLPPFSSEVVASLRSDERHAPFWSDFRRRVP